MSWETSNAHRLLLYGTDSGLLETRPMVLRAVGMANLSVDIDDLAIRIVAPNFNYRLVICCHTATKGECDEVVAIASRNFNTINQAGAFFVAIRTHSIRFHS